MLNSEMIWYAILGSMTVAYGLVLYGVHAAKQHRVTSHARGMTAACLIVALWLLGYMTKQFLFGREMFGGTTEQYWWVYVPILTIHTLLAFVTIALAGMNLHSGFRRLRHGSGVGAMVAGLHRHRALGKAMVLTLTGTMVTAYTIYFMLFHWFSAP